MRFSLFPLILAASAAGAQTRDTSLALIPQPRQVARVHDVTLKRGVTIDLPANAEDRFAARDLGAELKARDVRVVYDGSASARVEFARSGTARARRLLGGAKLEWTAAMNAEGYAIVSSDAHLTVIARSAAGMFYGVQTVKQLVDGEGATAMLHLVDVRDWPAMRYRGFHDDLSRGPMPTLEFQKYQIRTLAAYKINVYSPYFENTLYYSANPVPAPPGGAMTRAQVKELVAYAAHYHIDVIPEQEAFGHLHHMLKYDLYSDLAETPHGHVLAPGQPGSMALIKQMFWQIDSQFPSRFVHLGADETVELGKGQTRDLVKADGLGPVYLGFLKSIDSTLKPLHKRLLFWGDIASGSPELVKTLPKDMIAVAWGYGPSKSFDRAINPFRQANMETWVAPGVSNWSRVYPDNDVALRNIQGFVRDGQRLGATGVLNTSWDDDGEAIFNQTWYGVLFGAAAGWQPGESSIPAFEHAYGRVFHGDTTGKIDEAQMKLSQAHALLDSAGLGDANDNLFWIDPWSPEGQLAAQKIRPVLHDLRVLAESSLVLIDQARPLIHRNLDAIDAMALGARKIDFIGMKFEFADEMVQMYARAADTTTPPDQRVSSPGSELIDISGMNGRALDLRDGYSLIRDLYEQAWLRENRPYWIHNVLARYDMATQLWIARADRVSAARSVLGRTHRLPPADSVGIPVSMPGLNTVGR
ncbi:MAG TPA: family 20 glycosylhydrolase [Gemmatimonadaceae bacterium]|nr:family 20 glycosylhydrolase [Gemmatimonadaceae bacterium]